MTISSISISFPIDPYLPRHQAVRSLEELVLQTDESRYCPPKRSSKVSAMMLRAEFSPHRKRTLVLHSFGGTSVAGLPIQLGTESITGPSSSANPSVVCRNFDILALAPSWAAI
jgi:hypothetical protein